MNLPPAGVVRPVLARWWRPVLIVVGLAAAVLELNGHLPSIGSMWGALTSARPGWLAVAVALQLISISTFAEQQRHLLAAFGVRMRARAALALSYAQSALSTSLPAGSAVSAGYTFRQFRAYGASQPVAGAVVLLSGVASVGGLALLYAGDALSWVGPWKRTLTIAVVVAAAIILGVRRVRANRSAMPPAVSAAADITAAGPRSLRHRVHRLGRTLRDTAALAGTISVRRWVAIVTLGALNWALDMGCLLAALYAVGLAVPVRAVATAYLVVQLVRHIPLTPGGIGVVEASLILALTTAGAAAGPALAAVLIYRVLSCWALIPIGMICWTALKAPAVAPSAEEEPAELVRAGAS